MANENPTGSGDAVSVTIPADDAKFLRRLFTMALEGVRAELDDYPEGQRGLREPTRLQREEDIYKALLAALDGEPIFPDHDVRWLLRDLTEMNDRENEYTRALAEHDALLGLRAQLGERGRR